MRFNFHLRIYRKANITLQQKLESYIVEARIFRVIYELYYTCEEYTIITKQLTICYNDVCVRVLFLLYIYIPNNIFYSLYTPTRFA